MNETIQYLLFYKHRLTSYVNIAKLSDEQKVSIKGEIARVELYINNLENS